MQMFDPTVRCTFPHVQEFPESLLSGFPQDPEEFMDEMMIHPGHRWFVEHINDHMTDGEAEEFPEGSFVHRSVNWVGNVAEGQQEFCPAFKLIFEACQAHSVSTFIGQGEAAASLDWHVDSYHVWAFNMIGTTTWEWFDPRYGGLKSATLEPMKHVITMPSGVTHRVKLHGSERLSLSFIQDVRFTELGPAHTPFNIDEEYIRKYNISTIDF